VDEKEIANEPGANPMRGTDIFFEFAFPISVLSSEDTPSGAEHTALNVISIELTERERHQAWRQLSRVID